MCRNLPDMQQSTLYNFQIVSMSSPTPTMIPFFTHLLALVGWAYEEQRSREH